MGYYREVNRNEGLADLMHEAAEHDAALYTDEKYHWYISDAPIYGCRQVAPIFTPVRPLSEVRA